MNLLGFSALLSHCSSWMLKVRWRKCSQYFIPDGREGLIIPKEALEGTYHVRTVKTRLRFSCRAPAALVESLVGAPKFRSRMNRLLANSDSFIVSSGHSTVTREATSALIRLFHCLCRRGRPPECGYLRITSVRIAQRALTIFIIPFLH